MCSVRSVSVVFPYSGWVVRVLCALKVAMSSFLGVFLSECNQKRCHTFGPKLLSVRMSKARCRVKDDKTLSIMYSVYVGALDGSGADAFWNHLAERFLC